MPNDQKKRTKMCMFFAFFLFGAVLALTLVQQENFRASVAAKSHLPPPLQMTKTGKTGSPNGYNLIVPLKRAV